MKKPSKGESALLEIAKIRKQIKALKKREENLREVAFSFVDGVGGVYETSELYAQISRPETIEADIPKLLEKFGSKAHPFLTVRPGAIRAAIDSNILGPKSGLRGIVRRVKESPRLTVVTK